MVGFSSAEGGVGRGREEERVRFVEFSLSFCFLSRSLASRSTIFQQYDSETSTQPSIIPPFSTSLPLAGPTSPSPLSPSLPLLVRSLSQTQHTLALLHHRVSPLHPLRSRSLSNSARRFPNFNLPSPQPPSSRVRSFLVTSAFFSSRFSFTHTPLHCTSTPPPTLLTYTCFLVHGRLLVLKPLA